MANAGIVMEEKVADVVIANLKLCGVAADAVPCPVGDLLTASEP